MNIMIKRNRGGSRCVCIIAAAVIAAFALILPKSEVLATTSLSVDSASVDLDSATLSYSISGGGAEGERLYVMLEYPRGSSQSSRTVQNDTYAIGEYLSRGGTGTYKWCVLYVANDSAFSALQTSCGNNWYNLSTSSGDGYGTVYSFKSGTFNYTAPAQKLAAPTGLTATLNDQNNTITVNYSSVDNAAGYIVYFESHKQGTETRYWNSQVTTGTSYTCGGIISSDYDYMIINVVAAPSNYSTYANSDRSEALTVYSDGRTENGSTGGSSSTSSSSTESSSSSSSDNSSSGSSSSDDNSSSESSSSAEATPATPAITATTAGGQSITSWSSLDNTLKSTPLKEGKSTPVQVTLTSNNATIPADTFKALATSASPMHVLTGNGIGITFSAGSGSRQESVNVASKVQNTPNGQTISFSSHDILNASAAIHTSVPTHVKSVKLYFVIKGQRLGLGSVPVVNGRVMFPIGVLGTYELAY